MRSINFSNNFSINIKLVCWLVVVWALILCIQNYHYLRWQLIRSQNGFKHLRYELLLQEENTFEFYDILHEPDSFKSYNREETTLLVLIPSNPYSKTSLEKRNTIRTTWGNVTKFRSTYKLIFVMGKTSDVKMDADILKEMRQYNDVIVTGLIDSYDSLLPKFLSALKYASKKFNAEFVLKCDEDVYINIPILIYLLKTKYADTYFYGGVTYYTDPNRDEVHRHFVPFTDYPFNIFPPYTKGSFYVISGNLIDAILMTSSKLKRFSLDDAYPGVVLRIHGISPTEIEEFHQVDFLPYFLPFYGLLRGGFNDLAAIGDGLSQHHLRYIDKQIKSISDNR